MLTVKDFDVGDTTETNSSVQSKRKETWERGDA